ncbi:transmembrane protein 272 isoform 2, partial [Daubentonia madagascariensis]
MVSLLLYDSTRMRQLLSKAVVIDDDDDDDDDDDAYPGGRMCTSVTPTSSPVSSCSSGSSWEITGSFLCTCLILFPLSSSLRVSVTKPCTSLRWVSWRAVTPRWPYSSYAALVSVCVTGGDLLLLKT